MLLGSFFFKQKTAYEMIDAIERLEQVPRERDVLHELRHPPITDHAAVGGREREVLEHRLAAERAAGVHPELDVADQVLEASAPRGARDVGVGHAHDRLETVRGLAGAVARPLAP